MRRLASLVASLLFAGCASSPAQWHEPRECRVREEIVDAYLDRVVNLTIEKMSTVALAQYEQATMAFEIGGDGSVSNIPAMSASHPVAAEAARALKRFDPPHELIQDCVARGPILLWIPLSEL